MRALMMAGLVLAAGAGVVAVPAEAKDSLPCPAGLVCASKPSAIYAEIRAMERSAKLTKDKDGDPMIEVDGPIYKYTIFFMDCDKNEQCAAIEFSARFESDPIIDLGYTNRWNLTNRIPKASIEKDGEFLLHMEVSTAGGISRENLRDWKKWWDSGLSDYSDFYDKESAERDPKNRT